MTFVAAMLLGALLTGAPARPADGLEAREHARACAAIAQDREVAVASCRKALELGLNPQWAASIRLLLARKLAELQRWEEAVGVYRELAASRPEEPESHARLGQALLHGRGQAVEAAAALRESVRLGSKDAAVHAALAIAQGVLGRHEDAKASCDELERLQPDYLETRPATAAACAAARRGTAWPAPPRAPTEEKR